MKRKFTLLILTLALTLAVLPACESNVNFQTQSSIKTITRPYIAQYECTEARYGDIDLLENYEYIKIIFLNNDEMEIVYKPKDGEKKTFNGTYTVNPQTRELEADLGILGYNFKEKVKVEKGKIVISKLLGQKELFIKFEVK